MARERGRNILSYVDFSHRYYVLKSFPELKQDIVEEDITFPLSSISRAIEWRNEDLIKLE